MKIEVTWKNIAKEMTTFEADECDTEDGYLVMVTETEEIKEVTNIDLSDVCIWKTIEESE